MTTFQLDLVCDILSDSYFFRLRLYADKIPTMVYLEMAGFSKRPDRFLGVHFFNPVQVRVDGLIF